MGKFNINKIIEVIKCVELINANGVTETYAILDEVVHDDETYYALTAYGDSQENSDYTIKPEYEIFIAKEIVAYGGEKALELSEDEDLECELTMLFTKRFRKKERKIRPVTLFGVTASSVIIALIAGMLLQKYVTVGYGTDLISGIWNYIRSVHFLGFNWPYSIVLIPVVITALLIHEYAHAITARFLGDDGISLNKPWKFLHPIGLLMIFTIGFGIGGMVNINEKKFRNPQTDIAMIAVAGPMSNLLLGLICGAILFILAGMEIYPSAYISNALVFGITINLAFAGLNMLPIGFLDGEKVLMSFLPDRIYAKLQKSSVYKCVSILSIVVILIFILGITYISPFV